MRLLRTAKGLTLEALAAATGMTFGRLGKLERGALRMDVQTMVQLADALGVEPARLVEPSPNLGDIVERLASIVHAIDAAKARRRDDQMRLAQLEDQLASVTRQRNEAVMATHADRLEIESLEREVATISATSALPRASER